MSLGKKILSVIRGVGFRPKRRLENVIQVVRGRRRQEAHWKEESAKAKVTAPAMSSKGINPRRLEKGEENTSGDQIARSTHLRKGMGQFRMDRRRRRKFK